MRIRVGIGRPDFAESNNADKDTEVIGHVLGDFDASENIAVAEVLKKVNNAILCLLSAGLTTAMNRYN
jgi:peptidyl-tRNA hydrolase